jgi:uncharacterized membrane protein
MLLAVGTLFTVAVFREGLLNFILSLFHDSFSSAATGFNDINYIVPLGGDSPAEYYVFQSVQQNARWSPVFAFSAMKGSADSTQCSITVLPTVYSNMLGLEPSLIFKFIYPLILL